MKHPRKAMGPKHQKVYLWLQCEGWQRFGPFSAVHFKDDRIEDEAGNTLAIRRNGGWYTPNFESYEWQNPIVAGEKWSPD